MLGNRARNLVAHLRYAGGANASPTGWTTHSGAGTVDSVSGQIVTISHGPIKSLEWPAMTMPFPAKDAASVQGIKAGDRVEFMFSKSGNKSVLTSITKQ